MSTSELHTGFEGEIVEEIRDFLEWVEGTLEGIQQFGFWFSGRGFDKHDCFFLGLNSRWLVGCCSFCHGLLRPSRLAGGGYVTSVPDFCVVGIDFVWLKP
jgi:hypothetical protein